MAATESGSPDHYAKFSIELEGKPTDLYDVLRCGLVHEYFGKGLVKVVSDPTDPTCASRPGVPGVYWESVTDNEGIHDQLVFDVNAYFKHFRAAVENLRHAIIADTTSNGARANFETATAASDKKSPANPLAFSTSARDASARAIRRRVPSRRSRSRGRARRGALRRSEPDGTGPGQAHFPARQYTASLDHLRVFDCRNRALVLRSRRSKVRILSGALSTKYNHRRANALRLHNRIRPSSDSAALSAA